MLSELHNTNAINYWLTEWTRSGAPIPKEVVTGASRALLSATIRAFTTCKSIGEYADSLWQKPSACYIRIDVAHFIKIYASLVKDLPRRVPVFHLGSIGQLILSKSLKEAEKILGSILLVSQCKTEGYLPSGEPCKSEAAKYSLKEIITSSEVMKLTEIPVYFKNPLNDKEHYQLVGLVNYTPPPPKRKSSQNQGIGHSTAYCLRGGYQWVEYDDSKKNERNKKSNVFVQPVLLVFVRNKI
ncbi:unnamed protein product [Phaedon cochleariae]|uniref:Uncharacterized protein n=1 Tax=Phaedon cochleariae TaxID=80249 RepID=A0A9N9SD21_PHACE|nr:unnamed protein product [Phaedon cochleariae]